jgi:hypothetical protein
MPRKAQSLTLSLWLVGGGAVFGFPEGDAGDGKPFGTSGDKNFAGNIFGGGIFREKVNGLVQFLEDFNERVVFPENHFVVEMFVDPSLEMGFDFPEIYDHAPAVQRLGGHLHVHPAVVPMGVPAFSLILPQPMTVTEVDLAYDAKHGKYAKISLRVGQPVSSKRSEKESV